MKQARAVKWKAKVQGGANQGNVQTTESTKSPEEQAANEVHRMGHNPARESLLRVTTCLCVVDLVVVVVVMQGIQVQTQRGAKDN